MRALAICLHIYTKRAFPYANSLFGQAGSQYDFSNLDIGQSKDRARVLEEQQRGMKKKVNPKVMNMIDTCVLCSTFLLLF